MPTLVMTFLKAPRPGTVKTRLGREMGFAEATAVYRDLAEQQLRRIPDEFRTEIHYAPHGAVGEMRAWLGRKFNYRVQRSGDLGQRMRHAFAHAFERGCQSIIAIGSDCPELDEPCLRRAAALLATVDVVLGPATDGGYYLIGLRRPAPRLFEEIEWSTATVLATTLERVRECQLTHALLREMEDIDDLAALRRHQAKGTAGPVREDSASASVRHHGCGRAAWAVDRIKPQAVSRAGS
ncbi:MAG: TIGR04282 family arsenosugar biosynthesis glycosyltransferase [Opitutae bacterium]|nr:TIGR04282 family arsenosugar biosynthesis glycosyltransferase [Opitutae bacterium]